MQQTILRLFFALALFLFPLAARADVATYDVDLSGVAFSGNTLRVFGTITLDPELTVGTAIQSSSLQFQFESSTPVALPSIPSYSPAASTTLDWEVDGPDLYITRISSANGFFAWNGVNEGFVLGAGTNPHFLVDFVNNEDEVTLKGAGGPDGPLGFHVGTAIPEPASAGLIAVGAVFALCRRGRRR